MNAAEIQKLNDRVKDLSPQETLRFFLQKYGDRIALASSLGLEDQALTDMLRRSLPAARIFTIDTGRLFPETYSLIDRTSQRYNAPFEIYFPDYQSLEPYLLANGVNAFYNSVEKRRECCRIRKIEPLKRVLATLDAWICGLRREQSVTRTDIDVVEWDATNNLLKINPLAAWTEPQVRDYLNAHSVPYNSLHNQGYPSIGCQPCTRAVAPGADVRSGRWWWEDPAHKECGLHK